MKIKAVLISDIHFTLDTLELATKALITAREKAFDLDVPLIVCGDTLDTKAIMRGECVNRLLEILEYKSYNYVETIVIVGNHDLINEKGKEHTLNFLKGHCTVVDKLTYFKNLDIYCIPYMGDKQELASVLGTLPKGATVIGHQGVKTAYMGHYVIDKSSLEPEVFSNVRFISGHYHEKQDVKCGSNIFSYVGNPYTSSFGEADDGPKGYCLLNEDNSLTHVPLNLRKHIVAEGTLENFSSILANKNYQPGDLVWIKLHCTKKYMVNKNEIRAKLFGDNTEFKLDLIYDETDIKNIHFKRETSSAHEILDKIIDSMPETDHVRMKHLWRALLNEAS